MLWSGSLMTEKRFKVNADYLNNIDSIIDNETGIEYDYLEIGQLLNGLSDENKQYKKNSISLKQLYKILEENKEHFLSLSECFSEKLLIKTIFRNIDEDIESRELSE